jgi:hypothetical protein
VVVCVRDPQHSQALSPLRLIGSGGRPPIELGQTFDTDTPSPSLTIGIRARRGRQSDYHGDYSDTLLAIPEQLFQFPFEPGGDGPSDETDGVMIRALPESPLRIAPFDDRRFASSISRRSAGCLGRTCCRASAPSGDTRQARTLRDAHVLVGAH